MYEKTNEQTTTAAQTQRGSVDEVRACNGLSDNDADFSNYFGGYFYRYLLARPTTARGLMYVF